MIREVRDDNKLRNLTTLYIRWLSKRGYSAAQLSHDSHKAVSVTLTLIVSLLLNSVLVELICSRPEQRVWLRDMWQW